MDQGSYLKNSEEKLSEVSAKYKKEWSEGDRGQLICTTSRVIFFNNSNIIDIDSEKIDSMEYTVSSFDKSNLYGGLFFLALGVAIAIGESVISNTGLSDGGIIFASAISIIGLMIIGWSLMNRKETLEVHTSNRSFIFISKGENLLDILQSARGG